MNYNYIYLVLIFLFSCTSEEASSQIGNCHKDWAELISAEIIKKDLPSYQDIDSVVGIIELNKIESIKKSEEYKKLDSELSSLFNLVTVRIIENKDLWGLDEFKAFEIETYKNLMDMVYSDSLCAKLRYPNVLSICNSHRLSVLFQLDKEIIAEIEAKCSLTRQAQVQFSSYMHTNFGIEMWPLITQCDNLYIMVYSVKGIYAGSLIRINLDETLSEPKSFSIINDRVQNALDYHELCR